MPSKRVDQHIAEIYHLSRRQVTKMIEEGKVREDGDIIKKAARFNPNRTLDIELPDIKPIITSAQNIPLQIIYEDNNILVIDKPSGLVVHPSSGHDQNTVVNAVLNHLGIDQSNDSRFGIVHRLDKDTSGVLIVAKNERFLKLLKNAFKNHRIEKEYLALISGELPEPAGEITQPIARDPRNRLRFAIRKGGKESITRYFTERKFANHTLLRVLPVTGRTHQIRVHLKSISHPVVGDKIYGGEASDRLFLHATKLALKLDGKERVFESLLPKDLVKILNKID